MMLLYNFSVSWSGLLVKFFRWSGLFVVSRVLVEAQEEAEAEARPRTRTRRDPTSSRPEKRGHVLDQTHEHDLAGGGLLVLW